MKIGIDAAGIRSGGGFVYLKNLLEDYEADKFADIKEIIVWGAGSTLDKIEAKAPIRKVSTKFLESQNIFAIFFWKLYITYSLAPKQCDVLYVPGGIIFPSKQKKIIMLQNLLPFDEKYRSLYKGQFMYFKLLLLERLYKYSYKKAAGVIFPSKFAKENIENNIKNNNQNSTVIYHSVGKIFREYKQPVKPENKEVEITKLLCVSTITEYKGQFELLDDFEKLIKTDNDYNLTFVGGISEHLKDKFFTRLKQLNRNKEVVKYLGIVEYEKMPDIYRQHDVLVFPSRIESFGYPIIEAFVLNKRLCVYNLKIFKDITVNFAISTQNIRKNAFSDKKENSSPIIYYSNYIDTFNFVNSIEFIKT